MITNMQIVNHVRDDELRVLAIFNLDGWGDWPCQLCADNEKQEFFALGMNRTGGDLGWVRLSAPVVDAAIAVYDADMTAIFGDDWRNIQDGTARVLEWVFTRAA
ncbi:hypothetical protein ACTDI4_11715 [Mesorhizobium sp. PUT5]|uniref:hypothetical protein n=1 Tax=Mesorhizobium sp. PUT5 TaxID=3454629 RepID=UPI003FA44BBB